MNNSNYEDRIEAYLVNKMSSVERDEFEAELTHNKALAQQLKLYTLESAALHLLEQEELRGKFKDWKAEKQQLQQKTATIRHLSPSKYLRPISIAASFALMLVAGVRWANVNYSNQAIAASLFEGTTSRSSEVDATTPFSEVKDALSKKEYDQAIQLLDSYQNTDLSAKATLMKAEVYYLQGNYQGATTTYLSLINNPTEQETIVNTAKLYLAGLYLKQKQDSKALVLLNALATTDNSRQKDAIKILKQYNSFWHRLTW